ncbi:hypothetical protein Q427_24150 [Halomonas sp. BC04]|nr:hypothetical protein Q427_24150 [Halomonas sp. BC04]
MIVDNLDIVGVTVLKAKAKTPLIVDADTVLAFTITSQHFKTIAWRNTKIIYYAGRVELP